MFWSRITLLFKVDVVTLARDVKTVFRFSSFRFLRSAPEYHINDENPSFFIMPQEAKHHFLICGEYKQLAVFTERTVQKLQSTPE